MKRPKKMNGGNARRGYVPELVINYYTEKEKPSIETLLQCRKIIIFGKAKSLSWKQKRNGIGLVRTPKKVLFYVTRFKTFKLFLKNFFL